MPFGSPAARSLTQGGRALASAMATWASEDSGRSDAARSADVDDLIRTATALTAVVASRRRNRDADAELVRAVAAVVAVAASLLRRRWARRPAKDSGQPDTAC